jgi:hypothetical protein
MPSYRLESINTLNLTHPIPVAPLIIAFTGRNAGMTQAEIFSGFLLKTACYYIRYHI